MLDELMKKYTPEYVWKTLVKPMAAGVVILAIPTLILSILLETIIPVLVLCGVGLFALSIQGAAEILGDN